MPRCDGPQRVAWQSVGSIIFHSLPGWVGSTYPGGETHTKGEATVCFLLLLLLLVKLSYYLQ